MPTGMNSKGGYIHDYKFAVAGIGRFSGRLRETAQAVIAG
jgi:hypothetical protein